MEEMQTMSRPELTGHASLFYNEKEARKYDSSSCMVGVQREITERAIELLPLDPASPSLVLDIGCGSGLSGNQHQQWHVRFFINHDICNKCYSNNSQQQCCYSNNQQHK